MYPSLAAAKAAVISVGEEIATQGLPLGICPLVFVFTGSGNGMVLGNDTLFLCPILSEISFTLAQSMLRSKAYANF